MRRLLGLALFVATFWGIWHFAKENATVVAVSYVFGVVDLPVWQALLGSFGAGFGLAGLGWLFFGLRARMVQRRYRKAVGNLESEIHQLRNLPLAPDSDLPEPGALAPGGGERGG